LADKYKVRSKLELNGRDAFERKKAALERLDGKGETLTFNEIADVLGISYMGAKELSRVESKEGRWKNLNFRRGRGNLARIPKSYVSDYIDTHEPTNRGWSYRGAEKRDGAPTQKDL
jgi:hypothetical protein